MARANVPRFGNWENEDNVPYTVYFDKARKNRGAKTTNPDEPQENPDTFPTADTSPLSPTRSKPRTRPGEPKEAFKFTPEHDVRQFGNPPAQNENMNQRAINEQSHGTHRQKPGRSAKPSAVSEQSFDRSPLHPHHQAKGGGRTSEGKNYEGGHGSTPGRSRQKSATPFGDESPDKGAAVPKFGAWNDSDPQSAENFTDIFNKVREERNAGPGNASNTPKHPSYVIHKQPKQSKKCGCFGW